MWERRYGFPLPARDDNAERQYAPQDIAKLRAIKRLMDAGLRPGKLIHQSLDQLNTLAESRIHARQDTAAAPMQSRMLNLLRSHDAVGAHQAMVNLLMRQGLPRF